MRAAQWMEPKVITLTDIDEPVAAEGQAVIEVAHCGICGTDLHSFEHGIAAVPGQVLGHEFSGRVLAAPGVAGLAVGDRVTARPLTPCGVCSRCRSGDFQICLGGHQHSIGYGTPGAFAKRVLIPQAIVGSTVFKLPDEVSDRAGAIIEPLAVSLRAVRLAKLDPADSAVVFGLGPIGLGVVRWLSLLGADAVIAVDPSAFRRERALAMGATHVVDPVNESVVDRVKEVTGPGGGGLGAAADVVMECSGSDAAYDAALKVIRHGGRMVVSAMSRAPIPFRMSRVVEKQLQILGSFAYLDEFPQVIKMLQRGVVDENDFISHTFDLTDISAAFATQLDKETSMKVLITP